MIKSYVVSAFTRHGTGGNKAGVVLDADKLSDMQMQKIATKLGFSETAFVCTSANATYKLRFFTTTGEVDLCGHATIAAWALLFQRGIIACGDYAQETKAGMLGIQVNEEGAVFMQQAVPEFAEYSSSQEIAIALGITADSIRVDLQPQVVSTGLRDILVPVCSKQILMTLRPDFGKIGQLCKSYDAIGLHVFALGEDNNCTAVARNFAPLVGIDEESATGTSNGALLCYLQKYDMLENSEVYSIEQGESMGQPSSILGKCIDRKVWIGGQTTLQEELSLSM